MNIADVIEARAKQSPHAVALISGNAVMSFAALDAGSTMVRIGESGWRETPAGLRASYDNCGGWMHMALCLHRALRRHQRLPDHLAPKHPLPAGLGAATTKQIVFQCLKVENGQKCLKRFRHGGIL